MTSSQNWVDDLPSCNLASSGTMTNQQNVGDIPYEMHEFEDRNFYFKQNDISIYGIFNGHCSAKAANFIYQRLPAELILDSDILLKFKTDQEIEMYIRNAFKSSEQGFTDTLNSKLASRLELMSKLESAADNQRLTEVERLSKLLRQTENVIIGGTQALVALIKENKLFLANVGCSRALTCTIDELNNMCVNQLTNDHNLQNLAELKRLARRDVNIEDLVIQNYIYECNGYYHTCTRSIGDCLFKTEHKKIEKLKDAPSCPIIADPEINVFNIKTTLPMLLVLITDGVYNAVKMTDNNQDPNEIICEIILKEFHKHGTLAKVCQTVLSIISEKHREMFLRQHGHRNSCNFREDMTLLIRYIDSNYDSENKFNPSESALANRLRHARFPYNRPLRLDTTTKSNFVYVPDSHNFLMIHPKSSTLINEVLNANSNASDYDNLNSNSNENNYFSSNSNSINPYEFEPNEASEYKYELDEGGNILPYVQFNDFYQHVSQLTKEENAQLENSLMPCPDENE